MSDNKKQVQRITLEIVWDDSKTSAPDSWSWRRLLDMDSDEDVKIVAVQDVTEQEASN